MYIITTFLIMYCFVFCFCCDWWPGNAINNVSVQYNGGSLPDIITVDPRLLPLGNPLKCHDEEVVFLAYEKQFFTHA